MFWVDVVGVFTAKLERRCHDFGRIHSNCSLPRRGGGQQNPGWPGGPELQSSVGVLPAKLNKDLKAKKVSVLQFPPQTQSINVQDVSKLASVVLALET